ncbi:MAG: hypothetical protein BJ554DRAFT_5636 [Olpidium bornovanus]|uniref:PH domain-containing protein n=1 Tax=Olpidium bornovanus TaxID=278681 RepID=A0A8H7ZYV9_9FUNG|nr:MAG: hypothetical protein BJ554DRAFT_5636 [Olpidium bornovanus]
MQEVEISPRDLLQHYVAVPPDQQGKTLVWWFSTKRKNISFGLYFKNGKLPTAATSSNVFISAGSSPTDSPCAPSTPQPPPPQPLQPRQQHQRHQHHQSSTSSSAAPAPAQTSPPGGLPARSRAGSNSRNLAALVSTTINNSLTFVVRGSASSSSGGGGGQPKSPPGQSEPGPGHQDTSPGSATDADDPVVQPGAGHGGGAADAPRLPQGTLCPRRRPAWSPRDLDMVCIRRIERYHSATSTIKGSHKITEENGVFVLVFDNTFSRNTSKRVTFFVAIKDGESAFAKRAPLPSPLPLSCSADTVVTLQKPACTTASEFQPPAGPPEDEGTAEISGWLLKKKRKKMQGWAKRWFQLDKGVLSYYKSPGAYCRGSIQIAFSVVSVHPPQRLIHIDSGSTVYHLKCLTQKDNEAWMSVIRKYYASGTLAGDPARSCRSSPTSHDLLVDAFPAGEQPASVDIKCASGLRKVAVRRADGNEPQEEVSLAINHLKDRHENVVQTAAKLLRSQPAPAPEKNAHLKDPSPTGRSRAASSPGDQGRLKLLKKAAAAPSPAAECHGEILSALSDLKRAQDRVAELLREELEKRREAEAALHRITQSASPAGAAALSDSGSLPGSLFSQEVFSASSFVPGPYPAPATLSPASAVFPCDFLATFHGSGPPASGKPPAGGTSEGRASREPSLNNVAGDDEFFDAEEIVLEEDSSGEEGGDVPEALEEEDDEDEADEDEEDLLPTESFSRRSAESAVGRIPNASGTAAAAAAPPTAVPVRASFSAAPVQRRCFLPAPTCAETVSMVSILRKNVGKDFSTLSMPVSTNEPITLLQKLAESLEYSELLDKACAQPDSATRMLYVAAFVVSGYASGRSERKPFNPMLGETYELVREDKGEQSVIGADGRGTPSAHISVPSLALLDRELIPFGTVHLALKASGDYYTWTLPTTWLRNLIGGNKYLEHVGDARIVNHATGDACVLQFKESGFFSSAKNEVAGTVTLGESRRTTGVTGRWSEALYHEIEPSQLLILWQARAPPPDAEQRYGFTAFAAGLNEITADVRGRLPRTDSRLRPDVRLFEEGNVDAADGEKRRVEERQRETRRAMEERGEAWRPAWFELKDRDPVDGNPAWVYKGGYWEARQAQRWPDGVDLW